MKNEIKRTGTARKVGRPRAYTPEALEAKFEEYVEWVKANPVYINKVSAGEIIPVPTQRPLTLVGFCQFAKISRQNFYEYESREEFSDILTCVREAIGMKYRMRQKHCDLRLIAQILRIKYTVY